MKQKTSARIRRWLSLILAAAMALSLAVTGAWAEETEEYQIDLSSIATSAAPGDTISLTAAVSKDGEAITDLAASGLNFTFWADSWNDHADGNADAAISNEHSLTEATATLPTEGTYYIVGELYDSSWNKLASSVVTITVQQPAAAGYQVELSGIAASAAPGDTIALGAKVTLDGVEITDLAANGLNFTFWADSWNEHVDGNSDAVISNEHSLTEAFAALPSEGTYYIVGELYDSGWGTLASDCAVITVSAAAPEGYQVTVTASTDEPSVGDTVSLTAKVTYNGKEITDLACAGLYLWWWTDTWAEGHEDGLSDASYSNYDENSGLSLTADVTLPNEGTYYIAAELQDNSYARQAITYIPLQVEKNTYITGDLDIEKISGLDSDFIMGLDISSVVSEFDSGVTFKDYDGNTLSNVTEFCQFLKSCGITHIRVRVWNDPFDADGNGYGGGNNGIDAAVEIAEGCAAAGLKLLVDFHYSDFWADPSKQQVPKAWAGYSLEQKAAAIQTFTAQSLQKIAATGAEIDMVQVGNETTNSFVGETGAANMCTLFSAGSAAIRNFDSSIQVVIHVTNPEKSRMTEWAKNLETYGVDYDILATSYYPYWHGTLDNLKSQFQEVRETYGKDVMVAETSYAYTLADSDGHDNTVRVGTNDTATSYPFTPQGQADCIRDIMAAVSEAGGLGVYYWEPAWITVGDTTGLSGDAYEAQVSANEELWEQFGSGWASSYAAEYDPDDAGVWYGGSAVDNQAFFYPDGTPVASLHVWDYVKTGAVSNRVSVDGVESIQESIELNGSYTLPDTVKVTYNKGTVSEPVTWDAQEAAAVNPGQVGTYVVHGTVALSKEVTDGDYAGLTSVETTYTLTVKEPNLIPADAASFEVPNGSDFTISGNGISAIPAADDPKEGSHSMHWYYTSAAAGTVTYTPVITLTPGFYTFEAAAQGYAGDIVTLNILDPEGKILFSGKPIALTGWAIWMTPSVSFEVTEETEIQVQVEVNMQAGGWGTVDCLYLHQHEHLDYTDKGDGTHAISCADCGAVLGLEACSLLPVSVCDVTEEQDAYILYRCVCGAEKTVPLTAQIRGLPDSISLQLGRSVNLVADFTTGDLPEGVTCQGVYASSNTKVLRVSDQGRLTPVRKGRCELTYSVQATVTLAGGSQTVVIAQKTVPVAVSMKPIGRPDGTPGHQFPCFGWLPAKWPFPICQRM